LTLSKIFSIIVQECTTFELGIAVIEVHEPPWTQMKKKLEIFVDFDDLLSNFLDAKAI